MPVLGGLAGIWDQQAFEPRVAKSRVIYKVSLVLSLVIVTSSIV
jgi:hypothetical protein